MNRWRILVCGWRAWPRPEEVVAYIRTLNPETVIITGVSGKVDLAADREAVKRGMIVVRVPYPSARGKSGGPQRNRVMLEICDEVVAFWDGRSAGTKSVVLMAKAMGRPLTVHRLQGGVDIYGSRAAAHHQ